MTDKLPTLERVRSSENVVKHVNASMLHGEFITTETEEGIRREMRSIIKACEQVFQRRD